MQYSFPRQYFPNVFQSISNVCNFHRESKILLGNGSLLGVYGRRTKALLVLDEF